MDLIFWRHADAFESLEGQEDLSRTLTPKGEKQALRMKLPAWILWVVLPLVALTLVEQISLRESLRK